MSYRFSINREPVELDVPGMRRLLDVLREDMGLTGTKEGWSHPAADEEWQQGFYQEIQDFLECVATGRRPQADAMLAQDTVAALYAGYRSAARGGQETTVTS